MTRTPSNAFDQLAQAMARLLPGELAADVRKNVEAAFKAACDRLELVTREELEVQEAVLARTREKLRLLEAQVAELERRSAPT